MIAKSKKTSLVIKVDVLAENTFSGIVVIDDNFYTAGNYSEKWRLDCFDIENEINAFDRIVLSIDFLVLLTIS